MCVHACACLKKLDVVEKVGPVLKEPVCVSRSWVVNQVFSCPGRRWKNNV